MRKWVLMPFYAVCYLLWSLFGWSVWMVVRALGAITKKGVRE